MGFIPLEANIYLFSNKCKEFMSNLTLIENKTQGQSPFKNAELALAVTVPSVQRLLDVISSIIADEYIMIAKQNPEVFRKHGVTI